MRSSLGCSANGPRETLHLPELASDRCSASGLLLDARLYVGDRRISAPGNLVRRQWPGCRWGSAVGLRRRAAGDLQLGKRPPTSVPRDASASCLRYVRAFGGSLRWAAAGRWMLAAIVKCARVAGLSYRRARQRVAELQRLCLTRRLRSD